MNEPATMLVHMLLSRPVKALAGDKDTAIECVAQRYFSEPDVRAASHHFFKVWLNERRDVEALNIDEFGDRNGHVHLSGDEAMDLLAVLFRHALQALKEETK